MISKQHKIYAIVALIIIALAVTVYFLSAKNTLCNSIEIKFIDTGAESIIKKETVEQIIFSEYENLFDKPIDALNLDLLERKIEDIPSVKKADVFKKINGVLGVKIKQRKPIVRIFSKTSSFYIDEEGKLMPLSDKGTVRVLCASGNIEDAYKDGLVKIADTTVSSTLKNLYALAKFIAADDFLQAMLEQIYVTNKGEYELVPLTDNYIINLGDMYNYKDKLYRLKQFYVKYGKTYPLKKYKYINLKYKGQIVCSKKN